jgi:drug/metabolite transporter (DMT)-like permease
VQTHHLAPSQRRIAEGLVLVFAACTSFGSVPVLARLAYDHGAGTFTFLSGRYVLAGLALGLVVVLGSGSGFARPFPWRATVAAGVTTLVANIGYFGAVSREDVTRVAPLVFLFPVLVPLIMAALGRERLRPSMVVAASVGVVGSVLAVTSGFALPRDGVAAALALVATFGNAIFIIVVASALRSGNWAAVATAMFALASVVLVPLAIVTGSGVPDARGWLFIALAGLVGTGATYGLWMAGLRLAGESRTAALAVWEPTVTVILAIAVLDEVIDGWQAVGIALVLGSLVAQGRRKALQHA